MSRNKLSSACIEEAFEAVDIAVMIARDDGIPVIVNSKMNELAVLLTGRRIESGNKFLDALQNRKSDGKVTRFSAYDKLVFRMLDGVSWEFSTYRFKVGNDEYLRISAVDVTQIIAATQSAGRNTAAIQKSQNVLQWTLDNAQNLKDEETVLAEREKNHETVRAAVSNNDYGTDRVYSKNIKHLQNAFKLAGVELKIMGTLSHGDKKGLILSIIQKVAAKAVSASEAKTVTAAIYEGVVKTRLTVTADETDASEADFTDLYAFAKSIGAQMEISLSPVFKANVSI